MSHMQPSYYEGVYSEVELKPVLFRGDSNDLDNHRALKSAWKDADRAVASAGAHLAVVKGESMGAWGAMKPQPSLIPEAQAAYTVALEFLKAVAAQARAYGLR